MAKEFGTVAGLVAATGAVGYGFSMLPWWAIASYLAGVGIVLGAVWRAGK